MKSEWISLHASNVPTGDAALQPTPQGSSFLMNASPIAELRFHVLAAQRDSYWRTLNAVGPVDIGFGWNASRYQYRAALGVNPTTKLIAAIDCDVHEGTSELDDTVMVGLRRRQGIAFGTLLVGASGDAPCLAFTGSLPLMKGSLHMFKNFKQIAVQRTINNTDVSLWAWSNISQLPGVPTGAGAKLAVSKRTHFAVFPSARLSFILQPRAAIREFSGTAMIECENTKVGILSFIEVSRRPAAGIQVGRKLGNWFIALRWRIANDVVGLQRWGLHLAYDPL